MNVIYFIIENWNEICALALIVAVLVYCVRNGVNTNVDEFPKHRR